MELIQMKCPNCSANLEVEDGIDSFFCKYCGTKIMVHGQSNATVRAKARLKAIDKIAEYIEKDRQYYEDHKAEFEAQKEKERLEEKKNNRKILIGFILFFVLMFGALFYFEELPKRNETDRLNTLYTRASAQLANGRYREALSTANQIHWTANNDKTKIASWDMVREGLIDLIEEDRANN